MTERRAGQLAWTLYALGFAAAVASMSIVVAKGGLSADPDGGIDGVIAVSVGLVGALIASRRRENPLGWLLLAIALISAVEALSGTLALAWVRDGRAGSASWAAWLWEWITIPLFPAGLLTTLILVFPDGHPPSRRWRRLIGAGWLFTIVLTVLTIINSAPVDLTPEVSVRSPVRIVNLGPDAGGPVWVLGLVILLASVVGLVLRLRRARGRERQQLKWFAFVVTTASSVLIVVGIVSLIVGENAVPDWAWQLPVAGGFGLGLPFAFFVAIFGHGLYEIDVVIRKTVVYALFAAFATAVYLAIVIGAGTWVGRDNSFLTMVAAVVVAITFQPVRQRLTRFANRLVYGKRATPYEVLSDFSGRVGETFATQDLLPRMASVLAQGTGATRADVWLRVGDELRSAAWWPSEAAGAGAVSLTDEDLPALPGAEVAYPVRHQGELLGALTLSKPPSDPFSSTDEKLVSDLAGQAGLVLSNVQLTEDLRARLEELRAAQVRIVRAQDEERRKLERNIHDGAQQQLVALAVKLRLLGQLTERDAAKAGELAAQLQTDTTEALENLRDLARGIYPPLLADKGLAAALESQARKAAVPTTVESGGIGRYSQDVEATVYFSVLEAIQNVAKYAEASSATVRLSQTNGTLRFEVVDDGRGFDPASTGYGTGLQGIADRLAAIGGEVELTSSPGSGTTVSGVLPARPNTSAQSETAS